MKKILIVEDNDTTRDSLTILLNKRNYWVKTCSNGREALTALREGSMPDVLITDYFLEDTNGLAVIEFLRSLKGGDRTNCLIATAATPEYMEPLRELMSKLKVGVVFKPYEVDNMIEAIARMAYPDTLNEPIKPSDTGSKHDLVLDAK
jgi:CheY-like chemotaxis protein